MNRLRNFSRYSTTATSETISEHFNKNSKFYGVLITSVTLFGGVIWGRVKVNKNTHLDIKETETSLKKDINKTEENMKIYKIPEHSNNNVK